MLALAASTLFTVSARAQRDSLAGAIAHGVVRDTLSGDRIRRAVVRATPSGRSTLTDDDGRYRLQLAGNDTALDARAIGFRPGMISLTSSRDTTQDLLLRPIPVELATIVA